MKATGARIVARTPTFAMCFSTSYLLSKCGTPVCRLADQTEVKTRCTPAAMRALTRYAAAGIEETGLGLSDFGVLELLLRKGPLPVNTIGPMVDLTPGSISIAVDRLVAKDLVSRVESAEDRRVRIVALTPRGKDLIVSAFRKHSGQMTRVLSELSPEVLRSLEVKLKKVGKRAAALMEES